MMAGAGTTSCCSPLTVPILTRRCLARAVAVPILTCRCLARAVAGTGPKYGRCSKDFQCDCSVLGKGWFRMMQLRGPQGADGAQSNDLKPPFFVVMGQLKECHDRSLGHFSGGVPQRDHQRLQCACRHDLVF